MARKQPQRTCTGCKSTRDKRDLLRIVRLPDGELVVDDTGKRAGRGAYVCPDEECLDKAFKTKSLEKTLKEHLPLEVLEKLRADLLAVITEKRRQEELQKLALQPKKRGKL